MEEYIPKIQIKGLSIEVSPILYNTKRDLMLTRDSTLMAMNCCWILRDGVVGVVLEQ